MPTQINQQPGNDSDIDLPKKRYSRMSTVSKMSKFSLFMGHRKTIGLTDYKDQPVLHKFKDDEFYYEAVPICCGLWTVYRRVETDGMEIEEIPLSDIDSDDEEEEQNF